MPSEHSRMATIGLTKLMQAYSGLQSQVMAQVSAAASNISSTQPGQFLLLQFMMSTVSQVGQSISNLLSQVQTMIARAVQNQKS